MSKTVPGNAKEFEASSLLDEIAREGAQRMLAAALEAERDAFLSASDTRGGPHTHTSPRVTVPVGTFL